MKTYAIIGASSGIGLALAKQLVSEGHKVYGTYLNSEIDNSLGIDYHKLDVKNPFDLDFLPPSIDGLVYCPGSINLLPFRRMKPEAFMEDFQLQVLGAINSIQSAYGRLKKSDKPSILLFSTVAVQLGFNFHSQVAVSKGAIEGLCKSLAAEFSPSIRVNCIAPSLTETPLAEKLINKPEKKEANAQRHPLKRIGRASDIASIASFLLSENSSWITGQIIHVDGGMSTLSI